MIKRTGKDKYQVVSKEGKPLSKPDLTKEQAETRLKQVEKFSKEKKKK